MGHVDAGRLAQHLAKQMVDRAIAGRGDVDLAGRGLGGRDQFGDVIGREMWVGHHHVARRGHRAHRLEVFQRVEAGGLVKRRVDHIGAVGRQQQGVAIGLGPGGGRGADVAPGTRAVVDDELLAQRLRQLLGHDAGNRVIGAPGHLGHDQGHGLVRVLAVLGQGGGGDPGHGHGQQAQGGSSAGLHGVSPWGGRFWRGF